MNRAKIIGLLAVLLFCWTVLYAEKEFEVTNVDLSSTEWGQQMAKISVTKLASDYRFVIALSEVKFIDSVAAPSRNDKRVFIIGPADTSKSAEENTFFMEVPFLVPLAYGEGRVKFELYNVVDTLDALLASQRFYVKEIEFSVDTAEAFKALIDSGIQAPLFVDQSASFDSYFNRIISLLFYRGKTATEIANQCGVTPSFVHKNAQHLIKKGYLRFANKIYTPALTIIDKNRLEEILPEIDGTIDVVYDDLKKNLSQYDATLKELIDSKAINNDPHDMMNGGSILFHKYPTVFGLLLWNKLGVDFINDGADLKTFEKSDAHEAMMGEYMYLLEGGVAYKGNSFYYFYEGNNGTGFYCGLLDKPLVKYPTPRKLDGLPFKIKSGAEETWKYYAYNLSKTEKMLAMLSNGLNEPIENLKTKLDAKFPIEKANAKMLGARYWCWNYIVEKLIIRLENDKLIERDNSDVFMMQETEY